MNADHAQESSSRRLHHHPAFQTAGDLGAELLQARDLGGNVICLDIDMDAALMLHALNLHDRFVGRGFQHAIIVAAAWMSKVHLAAERFGPKASRFVHIRGSAVDQYGTETGMVHVGILCV